jgi:hypothetical protein
MSLIDHLESFLGQIDKGWKDRSSRANLSVACFKDMPFDGATTFCTLGLSEFVLPMGEREIRQELVFSAYEPFDSNSIASFLSTFAETIHDDNRALLRGDVIGPSSPIIFGTVLNAAYIAVPMVYDHDFAVYSESDPPTVFAWVVPIHETEADFVRRQGWKNFETVLEDQDPDLWDLHRNSVV